MSYSKYTGQDKHFFLRLSIIFHGFLHIVPNVHVEIWCCFFRTPEVGNLPSGTPWQKVKAEVGGSLLIGSLFILFLNIKLTHETDIQTHNHSFSSFSKGEVCCFVFQTSNLWLFKLLEVSGFSIWTISIFHSHGYVWRIFSGSMATWSV